MKKPELKILDKYIIRKFIGTYFFILMIATLIIIIFDISEKIDKFVDNQVPLKEIVFDYFGGFIPWILNSFSSIVVFLAVISFTSKLAQRSEIIAMLSSGISFNRMMRPYMLSAAFIATLTLLLGIFIIPPVNHIRLEFENKYIKQQQTASATSKIHYQIAPGEFVFVEQFSSWANTAYRFTLETIEDNRIVSKLSAESAVWDTTFNGWKLRNWYIRDFYNEESEIVRTGKELDTVIDLTLEDFYRRRNIAESLSHKELNELIDVQTMRGDALVLYALIEKNNRIAMPFSAFVLTVMGVALSSRKRRGGMGLNIGIGIALSFIYILSMRFSEMPVHTGALSPAFALWLPNIIFSIVALILYRMAPK
jgi:lipopolysaccharide export system permease protein